MPFWPTRVGRAGPVVLLLEDQPLEEADVAAAVLGRARRRPTSGPRTWPSQARCCLEPLGRVQRGAGPAAARGRVLRANGGPRPGTPPRLGGEAEVHGRANLTHRQMRGNNGEMPNAVIVDAVRTPVGRRNGRLSGWHPVDLAAQPLAALVERNDLDPALVEDVVMGCTMTVGEQAMNIARNAALAAGFPDTVPGTTVDRQCGSAQQAVHFAAQAVMAGAMDIVIAGGVESMSRVPIGSTTDPGPGEPYGPTYRERYAAHPPGRVRRGDRPALGHRAATEMDAFALESHRRAAPPPTRAASRTRSCPLGVRRPTAEADRPTRLRRRGPAGHDHRAPGRPAAGASRRTGR